MIWKKNLKKRDEELEIFQRQVLNLKNLSYILEENLKKRDEEFEKLQQYVLNLENRKNEEIQRLEIVLQNLEKNLKILEIEENDINIFKENDEKNYSINNNPTTNNNKSM
jgi:hypothetical protein